MSPPLPPPPPPHTHTRIHTPCICCFCGWSRGAVFLHHAVNVRECACQNMFEWLSSASFCHRYISARFAILSCFWLSAIQSAIALAIHNNPLCSPSTENTSESCSGSSNTSVTSSESSASSISASSSLQWARQPVFRSPLRCHQGTFCRSWCWPPHPELLEHPQLTASFMCVPILAHALDKVNYILSFLASPRMNLVWQVILWYYCHH